MKTCEKLYIFESVFSDIDYTDLNRIIATASFIIPSPNKML